MSIDNAASAAVSTLTHADIVAVAGGLLVLLVAAVQYIFKINLAIIDKKILVNKSEIDQLKAFHEKGLERYDSKMKGIEAMVASSGLKVQDLSKSLEGTKALTDAYIDRTERDISKLENRLTDIEKVIKENHEYLSAELHKVSQNVAVLISKSDQ